MPHYSVNIRIPNKNVEAIELGDYIDLQSVRDIAVEAIKDMLGDMFELGLPLRSCQLDILGEEGDVTLIVPIAALMH